MCVFVRFSEYSITYQSRLISLYNSWLVCWRYLSTFSECSFMTRSFVFYMSCLQSLCGIWLCFFICRCLSASTPASDGTPHELARRPTAAAKKSQAHSNCHYALLRKTKGKKKNFISFISLTFCQFVISIFGMVRVKEVNWKQKLCKHWTNSTQK